jgi:hypothetical protein
MKRREATPEGCGRNIRAERSAKEERSSKRCSIENEVSREDTRGSSSRVVENEVRSPWLMRDGV